MRTISRDFIVSLNGPGWAYPKARILTDTEGNAAVFIPPVGSAPVKTFTLNPDTSSMAMTRGKLDTSVGEITYRRTGSSCSFALAKCKVGTQKLAALWT